MKRRRQYKDFETPQEYLENVLNTWHEFCYVNCGLAQAIHDLLDINAALAKTVEAMTNANDKKKNR